MQNKILVAVDGSETGNRAIEVAAKSAGEDQCEINGGSDQRINGKDQWDSPC